MAEKTKTSKPKTKINKDYIYAIGRRKSATARVRLYKDTKGEIEVNGKRIEEYFPGEINKARYMEPLRTCNLISKNKISIKVEGSGKESQIDAVIHGLSKCLVMFDEEKNKQTLKKRGFLTRDPRARQRRKAGMGGKARRQRQSPRR